MVDPRKQLFLKQEADEISNLCFEHDLYNVKKIKFDIDDCKAYDFQLAFMYIQQYLAPICILCHF